MYCTLAKGSCQGSVPPPFIFPNCLLHWNSHVSRAFSVSVYSLSKHPDVLLSMAQNKGQYYMYLELIIIMLNFDACRCKTTSEHNIQYP